MNESLAECGRWRQAAATAPVLAAAFAASASTGESPDDRAAVLSTGDRSQCVVSVQQRLLWHRHGFSRWSCPPGTR